jgi:tRNA-dihydrouridine synthase 3
MGWVSRVVPVVDLGLLLTRRHPETLLASGDSRDWVRISEMFLGPAPEAWSFTPKHKSNAYESQG